MAKAWKENERRIAKQLGGKRLPVNGRGNQPDVAHEWLAIECKHRQSIPAWLKEAMAQARGGAKEGQLPVAVIHEHGARDSLVVLSLSDFTEWFGPAIRNIIKPMMVEQGSTRHAVEMAEPDRGWKER